MCGKKSRLLWLSLVALFFLSSGLSWAEELTEGELYLLAGEVSAEMKKAGLEAERTKLYRIFEYFTKRFELQEKQSLEWQNLSKVQESMLTDLQNQLDKASGKVTSLLEQLPILEDRAKKSETSLEAEIEESRWSFLKGAGIGAIAGAALVVVAKLFWK